ncbi:MAG: hypothetical protein CFE26_10850 [Verrucomicrobiales bacterium VVV1]|nr:MAG: hypothetical protein CFE26_10850 [Verrucomicrobiales bacterium VVV1]
MLKKKASTRLAIGALDVVGDSATLSGTYAGTSATWSAGRVNVTTAAIRATVCSMRVIERVDLEANAA